jgi:hypothetical protein
MSADTKGNDQGKALQQTARSIFYCVVVTADRIQKKMPEERSPHFLFNGLNNSAAQITLNYLICWIHCIFLKKQRTNRRIVTYVTYGNKQTA